MNNYPDLVAQEHVKFLGTSINRVWGLACWRSWSIAVISNAAFLDGCDLKVVFWFTVLVEIDIS